MTSTRTIPLANGGEALVDARDYKFLSQWRWHRYGNGYAARVEGHAGPRFIMHRVVWERHHGPLPASTEIDHWNRDGFDNRSENLRPATNSQNQANRRKTPGTTSQYKGVTWNKRTGRWLARIVINYKVHCLGYYDSEEDAGQAYDTAALEAWGAFARLNFPSEQHQ